MRKKIILIILIFLLMMNSLIGVIYGAENAEEPKNVEQNNSRLNLGNGVLKVSEDEKNSSRQFYLLGSIIIFLILSIIIERKKSIKILLKVTLTLLILYFAYIKAIVNNKSLGVFTIIVSFLLACVNIFIKNGIHRKSFSELISVLVTTGICGFAIFGIGIATNSVHEYNVNISKNITFGMAVLIYLGIFMGIISRITYLLDKEKDKAQDSTWKEQFKRGMEIGRELVVEKINMIFLIFSGIVLLEVCYYLKLGYTMLEVINLSQTFIVFLMAIIGGIGAVISVPITAMFYAIFNNRKTVYKTISSNKIDGKRSLKI